MDGPVSKDFNRELNKMHEIKETCKQQDYRETRLKRFAHNGQLKEKNKNILEKLVFIMQSSSTCAKTQSI